MAFGDPHAGLLKAIIDIFNERGPEWQQHSDAITQELKRRNYWGLRPPKMPERTVNAYVSQRKDVFTRGTLGSYFLNESHHRRPKTK